MLAISQCVGYSTRMPIISCLSNSSQPKWRSLMSQWLVCKPYEHLTNFPSEKDSGERMSGNYKAQSSWRLTNQGRGGTMPVGDCEQSNRKRSVSCNMQIHSMNAAVENKGFWTWAICDAATLKQLWVSSTLSLRLWLLPSRRRGLEVRSHGWWWIWEFQYLVGSEAIARNGVAIGCQFPIIRGSLHEQIFDRYSCNTYRLPLVVRWRSECFVYQEQTPKR